MKAWQKNRSNQANAQGFTLIELMIVVVIIAILGAIAYPAYENYTMKSRRTDATRALLDIAALEEKYYSQNMQYATALTTLGYASPAYSDEGYYKLSLLAAGTTYFTAEAAPVAGGLQANDKCGTFELSQTGAKTTTSGVADCWQ